MDIGAVSNGDAFFKDKVLWDNARRAAHPTAVHLSFYSFEFRGPIEKRNRIQIAEWFGDAPDVVPFGFVKK